MVILNSTKTLKPLQGFIRFHGVFGRQVCSSDGHDGLQLGKIPKPTYENSQAILSQPLRRSLICQQRVGGRRARRGREGEEQGVSQAGMWAGGHVGQEAKVGKGLTGTGWGWGWRGEPRGACAIFT